MDFTSLVLRWQCDDKRAKHPGNFLGADTCLLAPLTASERSELTLDGA
jgi:hypothetical protein